jgi:hypothetical protein
MWVECHFIEAAIHRMAFSLNAQGHLIFKTVSRIFLGLLDQKLFKKLDDCLRLVLPQLPLLEATCKVASTFPYKHSKPLLTTHLSGANPA